MTLANGNRLSDLSAINECVKDITKWPKIQGPDIYMYLEKPCVYTSDKLQVCKSIDVDSEIYVLKSEIRPSMYELWVLINKPENYVLTANCACMAR